MTDTMNEAEEKVPHVMLLPLTQGLYATVDSDVSEEIWSKKWTPCEKSMGFFYVYRSDPSVPHKHSSLHYAVLGVPTKQGLVIDHRNGDGLDNRRSNLRVCRLMDNKRNLKKWRVETTSRYKGVSWHGQKSKWRAYIVVNRVQKHLGCFDDEVAAAKKYDEAAKEFFGEYARPNFPT